MLARIDRVGAIITVYRSRRVNRLQLNGAGRRIDGRNEDEHSDEQRNERRQDAMPVRRSKHAAV